MTDFERDVITLLENLNDYAAGISTQLADIHTALTGFVDAEGMITPNPTPISDLYTALVDLAGKANPATDQTKEQV